MKLAIGLAVVLLVVALIVWSLVRRPTAASGPDEAMAGLRKQALTLPPEQLGQESKAGQPFAVIMDIGYPNAVVSVVAFKSGDASIYISTGGGVIGGIGHAPVRAAAGALVEAAREHLPQIASVSDLAYPGAGRVRIHVRTPEASVVAEAAEAELANGKHTLSGLYVAGQDVITQLRLVSEPAP